MIENAKDQSRAIKHPWMQDSVASFFDEDGNLPTGDALRTGRVLPVCHACGEPAEIVALRPQWAQAGCPMPAPTENPAGTFCCRSHTEATVMPWLWLIKSELRDDQQPTIQDFRHLLHVARKVWGMPFLAWLFTEHDLNGVA